MNFHKQDFPFLFFFSLSLSCFPLLNAILCVVPEKCVPCLIMRTDWNHLRWCMTCVAQAQTYTRRPNVSLDRITVDVLPQKRGVGGKFKENHAARKSQVRHALLSLVMRCRGVVGVERGVVCSIVVGGFSKHVFVRFRKQYVCGGKVWRGGIL